MRFIQPTEEELQEVTELASQCVKVAKNAWEKNFSQVTTGGDREAIGSIAGALLEHYLSIPDDRGHKQIPGC